MRRRVAVLAAGALGVALLALPALAAPDEPQHGAASGEAAAEAGHGEAPHAAEAHGPSWAALLINFVIFVGVLAYFVGRPARTFFRDRSASIADSLAAAERAREQAQAKLAEAEARLPEIERQAKSILDGAARQAEAERQRLVAAATDDAQRILAQAEARVGELESAARRRLRVLAADLAVEAATDLVERHVKPEDRSRALDRNLKALQSQGG